MSENQARVMIVADPAGSSICINERHICGNERWGGNGGTPSIVFKVDHATILNALKEPTASTLADLDAMLAKGFTVEYDMGRVVVMRTTAETITARGRVRTHHVLGPLDDNDDEPVGFATMTEAYAAMARCLADEEGDE